LFVRRAATVDEAIMTKPFLILASVVPATPSLARPATVPSASARGHGMALDQFLARQTLRIMAADTDGGGRGSKAEIEAMPDKSDRDPSRRFERMDANHDGYLDREEIRAALARRFQRMDRNGDGIVTPEERIAGRSRKDVDATIPAAPRP
jgi:hypothetical protein